MEAWCSRGPLRVPVRVAAGPVSATRTGVVLITGGGAPPHRSKSLAACSLLRVTSVKVLRL